MIFVRLEDTVFPYNMHASFYNVLYNSGDSKQTIIGQFIFKGIQYKLNCLYKIYWDHLTDDQVCADVPISKAVIFILALRNSYTMGGSVIFHIQHDQPCSK